MSYRIDDALTNYEVEKLLIWMYNKGDHYLRDNEESLSKKVDINANDWPKELISNILKRNNLLAPFEEVLFWTHKKSVSNSQGLHADTGDGNQSKLGKNILIPLRWTGDAATIIFKNRWYGSDAKFGYIRKDKAKSSVTNLNLVEDYDSSKLFDKRVHSKYLKHLDINSLHGFTIDSVEVWKPNTILHWDRQQIHCSAYVSAPKTGLIIFTNK